MCTSSKNVQDLRDQVACAFEEAFLKDSVIAGYSVRDLVAKSEHNLRSYVAALRWNLLASPVEVAIAADICKVSVLVSIEGQIIHVGQKGASYMMRLKSEHYTLH